MISIDFIISMPATHGGKLAGGIADSALRPRKHRLHRRHRAENHECHRQETNVAIRVGVARLRTLT